MTATTEMTRFIAQLYYKDSETADIAMMHKKFNHTFNLKPTKIRPGFLLARADFLQEELDELKLAIFNEDVEEIIDALVDLVVVAKGTAVMAGFEWGEHWNEVLKCNMAKELGVNPKRPAMKEDLIKPEGWVGPDHKRILES